MPRRAREFSRNSRAISDPYEVPPDADVTINTGELSAEEAAQEIILHLEREGFIGTDAESV